MKPHQRARILKLAATVIARTKVECWWVGDFRHVVPDEIKVSRRFINLCRAALDLPEVKLPSNPRHEAMRLSIRRQQAVAP